MPFRKIDWHLMPTQIELSEFFNNIFLSLVGQFCFRFGLDRFRSFNNNIDDDDEDKNEHTFVYQEAIYLNTHK